MTWTIESNALTWIVIIAVSVGFLAGLAISLFSRRSRSPNPPNKDLVELAHLWRNKIDGSLWLQIDEQSGNALNAFEGENQEKARKIAGELAAWTGRPIAPVASSRLRALANQDPKPSGTEAAAQHSTTPSEPQMAEKQAPVERNPQTGQPTGPEKTGPPRIDIVKGIQLTMEGSTGKAASEPSIAAQVDEILQEKLKGTELEKRGVRLMELPGRGMVVMIGLDQYDTVEDVPFPDIKALLKSAVAEWERKMLG